MTKISGQFLISGQFQDNDKISGQLGALQSEHLCHTGQTLIVPPPFSEVGPHKPARESGGAL